MISPFSISIVTIGFAISYLFPTRILACLILQAAKNLLNSVIVSKKQEIVKGGGKYFSAKIFFGKNNFPLLLEEKKNSM